jgi:hypothetical protein
MYSNADGRYFQVWALATDWNTTVMLSRQELCGRPR